MKVSMQELMDLVIQNFKAPISLLEFKDGKTQLINGLPITYFLRFISKNAEEMTEFNDEFHVEEISSTILKIQVTDSYIIIIEQDTEENVLNFDIG
ncbi:MAG: hypothetical protein N4A57_06050 [Anaeromicrobium sp.]|jgi:hypothetical protein|uniref:hypothetical protein n=1 Tax=Anaeromicrobium sp. TaxID=1929132 RepID=UPI0025EDB729|nr:hypothetical protein [Anaeromicrobium sp.]MCT4593816.1 hypothetical protein [Anaeromicrobium sp.]